MKNKLQHLLGAIAEKLNPLKLLKSIGNSIKQYISGQFGKTDNIDRKSRFEYLLLIINGLIFMGKLKKLYDLRKELVDSKTNSNIIDNNIIDYKFLDLMSENLLSGENDINQLFFGENDMYSVSVSKTTENENKYLFSIIFKDDAFKKYSTNLTISKGTPFDSLDREIEEIERRIEKNKSNSGNNTHKVILRIDNCDNSWVDEKLSLKSKEFNNLSELFESVEECM